MKFTFVTVLAALSLGCAALNKDNEPKSPNPVAEDVRAQRDVYLPLVRAGADAHGLAVMGGSIGDSALFSCLGRVGGAFDFDPAILLRNGQPVRHPDIAPPGRTPTSKDMTNGILWCIWDVGRKGDKAHARALLDSLVAFGKAHRVNDKLPAGWRICTDEDRAVWQISDEDWLGRCVAPPAMVKDIYRLVKWAGGDCDNECQAYLALGTNVPAPARGFERHLSVLTTMRNGLVEGALNDNSVGIVLEGAASAEPNNALYQAAYHTFTDGDQAAAYAALRNPRFPPDRLPTGAEFCTDYLFQRDEITDVDLIVDAEGCVTWLAADKTPQKECGMLPGQRTTRHGYNDDWLPCDDPSPNGRGVEYVFAAGVALGEVR